MADLNSKHVTWDGLQYYDVKIKQYVDTIIEQLKQSAVTPEQAQELQDRIDRIAMLVSANKATIEQLLTADVNINAELTRLTESDKQNAVNIADIKARIDSLATKDELKETEGNIKVIVDDIADLEQTVTTDHITLENVRLALENVATEDEIEGLNQEVANVQQQLDDKADKTDLNGLATEEFVRAKIAEAELNDKEVDLSQYYTKTEVDAKIPDVSNFATKDEVAAIEAKVDAIVIPEVPTKVSELENDAGYITAADIPETDLSNYYNKSETENLIAEAVKDIEHPPVDLTGYATEEWVTNQGFAKIEDIPSVEGLVTEEYLENNYVTTTALETKNYVTNTVLEEKNYITTQEVNSTFVTKQDVENTYVTNQTLSETVQTIEETYVTEAEVTQKVETVIQEKVESGEIQVNADAINYGDFEADIEEETVNG